jgi:hypothetical protein
MTGACELTWHGRPRPWTDTVSSIQPRLTPTAALTRRPRLSDKARHPDALPLVATCSAGVLACTTRSPVTDHPDHGRPAPNCRGRPSGRPRSRTSDEASSCGGVRSATEVRPFLSGKGNACVATSGNRARVRSAEPGHHPLFTASCTLAAKRRECRERSALCRGFGGVPVLEVGC